MNEITEKQKLQQLIKERKVAFMPVEREVAVHAFLLVGLGYNAEEALKEAKRVLDEAKGFLGEESYFKEWVCVFPGKMEICWKIAYPYGVYETRKRRKLRLSRTAM